MSTKRLDKINDERELMNYEYTHLYNIARHSSKGTLMPRRKLIQRNEGSTDQAEYGLVVPSDKGPRTWKFLTLERCQQEQAKYPGSRVVRLGRDSKSSPFDVLVIDNAGQLPDPRFLAHADESGNIETPESNPEVSQSLAQLVSNDLNELGFIKGSGCRPSATILREISMRYNDIVPEEFAAAVLKHCELPRPDGGSDSYAGKSPWRTPEAKQAWYDTPAGQAWVKENPVPHIFALPTPEILKHRRDTHDQ